MDEQFPGRGETQGKCGRCKVRYLWRGQPRLKVAVCPTCQQPLQRTTGYLTWAVRRVTPRAGTRA